MSPPVGLSLKQEQNGGVFASYFDENGVGSLAQIVIPMKGNYLCDII